MNKKIQLKKNDRLEIKLNDGTRITIKQDNNLKINSIDVSHHRTKPSNEISLDRFGYNSFENSRWTDCKSTFKDSKTKNETYVSHVAFNK
tara:strand:+ start:179 stop:448 length:270 start_codon:yes stop_codon:yes gene_type:complete